MGIWQRRADARASLICSWGVRKCSSLPPRKAKPSQAGAISGLSDPVWRKSSRGKLRQNEADKEGEISPFMLPEGMSGSSHEGPRPCTPPLRLGQTWRAGHLLERGLGKKDAEHFALPVRPIEAQAKPGPRDALS